MSGRIFDETFINGYEDHDLFLRIRNEFKFISIDYKIMPVIGASLGNGPDRAMLQQIDLLLLQEKYSGFS